MTDCTWYKPLESMRYLLFEGIQKYTEDLVRSCLSASVFSSFNCGKSPFIYRSVMVACYQKPCRLSLSEIRLLGECVCLKPFLRLT